MASIACRLTVNLVNKSVTALTKLGELNGLSKTDNINRAIQVYELVEGRVHDGYELAFVKGDKIENFRIL